MAYTNQQTISLNPPAQGGGGGWKLLQLLGAMKQKPLTGQQQAAFQQGAGPVSQQGAEQYFRNSFNTQTAYIPGNPYNGYPSMQSVFDRIRMGQY